MKVRVPVLAINGETDTQVPAKEDLAAIEQTLKDGGNNDYKIDSPIEVGTLNYHR